MAATIFLRSSGQTVSDGFLSDEIVSPPNGSLIVQLNGEMESAERWVIEQAMVGDTSDTAWQAVHRTDPGTGPNYTEWQGPRDLNRVFIFGVSDACRYRLRKIGGGTQDETGNGPISGGRTAGVTAFWAEWQTRLSI